MINPINYSKKKWVQQSWKPLTYPCDDGSSGAAQRHQQEGQQHQPEAHDSDGTPSGKKKTPWTPDDSSLLVSPAPHAES